MVGRQYFGKRDVDMDGSFQYTVQKPTMHRARLITEEIVRAFLERELDEIHIVYTQMQNAMAMENVNMQLLPLKKADFKVGQVPAEDVYKRQGRRKIHGDRAQTHREAEAFFWNGYDPGSASDNRDHDRWSDDP